VAPGAPAAEAIGREGEPDVTDVHPSAVVDQRAELAGGVEIGPGAVIGPDVRVGPRTIVGAHAILDGHLTVGADNRIFPHAVLGTPPQDIKYQNEPTRLQIGDRNLIREFVTVHRGTPQGKGVTTIGSDVFLMAYVHIAHDNLIEDRVVVSNSSQIAGHVTLGEHAIVGGCCAVHQFVRVGSHAFIGGGSVVVMDIPPFCKATGNRARLHGLNTIGVRRRGFTEDDLKHLRRAYRVAFQSNLLVSEAAEQIDREIGPQCPATRVLAEFLRTSRRGVTR
jgi:UDP-N-acetylglucosamine acyltransferase